MTSVGFQFFIGESGKTPDVFVRIRFPHAADKWEQRPLVGWFERFAAQNGKAADVSWGEQGEEHLFRFLGKGLAI